MINKTFDYLYYRLHKYYMRWEGNDNNMGAIGLAYIQGFSVLNVFSLFCLCFFEEWFRNWKEFRFLIVGVMIFFIAFNVLKYKNKFNALDLKWKDELPGVKRETDF